MKFLRNGRFEVSYKILKWVRDKFEKKKKCFLINLPSD